MFNTTPLEANEGEAAQRLPNDVDLPSRRDMLARFASAVFAGLVAPAAAGGAVAADIPALGEASPDLPDAQPDEDVLIRMMRELQRALQKPAEERRWVMVIDLRKCIGCHACTVACAVENKLPPGVVYRPVLEEELGTFPHVSRRFIPRPCMQCDNPPCVSVCPVKATWVRPDGIVDIDYKKCIGCRYCITACPYSARVFDSGHRYTDDAPEPTAFLLGRDASSYEEAPAYEYGKSWVREEGASPEGNVRKCHFCRHRVERGLLPQCVTSCIGRATFFGDGNDPDSLVTELIGKPNVMRLKEEMGTKPKVYYLT